MDKVYEVVVQPYAKGYEAVVNGGDERQMIVAKALKAVDSFEAALIELQGDGEETVVTWQVVGGDFFRTATVRIWVHTRPIVSGGEEAFTVAPAKAPSPGGTCDSAVVLGRTTYFDSRRGNAEDADAFHRDRGHDSSVKMFEEDADELRARIARGEG